MNNNKYLKMNSDMSKALTFIPAILFEPNIDMLIKNKDLLSTHNTDLIITYIVDIVVIFWIVIMIGLTKPN